MSSHLEGANGAATPPNPLTISPAPPPRDIRVVHDVIPVLDTGRFEHMHRIAVAMARTSVVPDSLRMGKNADGQDCLLPPETIAANCFLVVNQSVRWNMDPFAVAQHVSVVHGKLCYEGKLIHAVIEEKLGIRLAYTFVNEGQGNKLGVIVSGKFADEETPRTVEGDVENWHRGPKSPWANPKDWKRQLRYRGAREWARAHAPGVILGVYSDDEMEDLREERRAAQARDITPARTVLAPPAPPPHLISSAAAVPAAVTPAAPAEAAQAVTAPQQAPPTTVPPMPPAHLRGGDNSTKSAATSGIPKGNAAATAPHSRAAAPPSPPPAPSSPGVTSRGGGEGSIPRKTATPPPPPARGKFDGEKYLATLEHDITSCESMTEVEKVWARHDGFLKATPNALNEDQINRALGLYFDAQQVLGE